jgi:2-polyprenyl-6-methoxyphenol hydroxylase-like FAD-dependent oxidoreductase
MKNQRVLISGAGIAGPALALALEGFDVTVVERGGSLRAGGQAVDFRGPVQRTVLERMNLWDAIQARRTPGTDVVLLDPRARHVARLPAVMMSGDVEILRSDLSRLLYERTASRTEYRFGDSIAALEPGADDVKVTFASGTTERYAFVVGADGLHSRVRALAFGEEQRFVRHHGYRLATFTLPTPAGLTLEQTAYAYSEPGRSVMLTPHDATHARAQLIFTGGPIEARLDPDAQRDVVREAYAGVRWYAPQVLEAVSTARDLYVDQIATIAIDRYSAGRVVLLGDAAYGATLGGQGTPLAIVGAYILANELALADDPRVAFARYEAHMRPYATPCQKTAESAGAFFAPRTRLGMWFRDTAHRALTSRLLIGQFEKMVKASATDFALPTYAPRALVRRVSAPPPIAASA